MEYSVPFHQPIVRSIIKTLVAAAFGAITDFRVIGKENIPTTGPALIIANHFNYADPVALINAFPRKLDFIGGTELPNSPQYLRALPRWWGIFNVHRGRSSRDALMKGINSLNHGRFLAIFPEAGSWATVLRPARPGSSLLITRSAAPIIPVGLDGLPDIFPVDLRKRQTVTVNIGKPFQPIQPGNKKRYDREELDELGHLMMRKIAELLPPETRGFYSDDPAIREAAKGTEIYPWDDMEEK
ncbi:MAG: 1-acyl-sn-glycerol-3-phosphate acyltransferase [Anaerolineaceae bacterium]|nr:1-acyl-sn-glycerol-3-phosphate acyltransferase [Anaerolineaceae bacterium]